MSSGNIAAAIVAAALAADELWLLVVVAVVPVVLTTADKLVEFDDVVIPADGINGGSPAPAMIPPLVELPSIVLLRIGMLGAKFHKLIIKKYPYNGYQ